MKGTQLAFALIVSQPDNLQYLHTDVDHHVGPLFGNTLGGPRTCRKREPRAISDTGRAQFAAQLRYQATGMDRRWRPPTGGTSRRAPARNARSSTVTSR